MIGKLRMVKRPRIRENPEVPGRNNLDTASDTVRELVRKREEPPRREEARLRMYPGQGGRGGGEYL
jgi:hypothetical protein